jgi:hypothetical protein
MASSRSFVLLGLAALLLAAVGLLTLRLPGAGPAGPAPVAAQGTPAAETRGITVISEGVASAQPDRALLSAGVAVTRPTAAEALAEAGRVSGAILAKLDELGIPRASVQTAGLSLFPVYDNAPRPNAGEATITGYRAINQLTVRVDDLNRVGPVLDGVVAAGANQIGGVRFGLKDDSALRAQAIQAAGAGARPEAQAMAGSLGLQLGPVLSVREEGTFSPMPAAVEAAPADARTGVPIEGGQLSVRVRVQVTYAIAAST